MLQSNMYVIIPFLVNKRGKAMNVCVCEHSRMNTEKRKKYYMNLLTVILGQ